MIIYAKPNSCDRRRSKLKLTCSFERFVFQFRQDIVSKQENFKILCPFEVTRLNMRDFVVAEIKME